MSTDEQESRAPRLAQRDAYRAFWRSRLEAVLTDHWRWSEDIGRDLGETNAKVLERMRDLVRDGAAERCIVRLRKHRMNGPFQSFFRLPIGPPPPDPKPVIARRRQGGRHNGKPADVDDGS
jgi:hypothetical protein